MFKRVAEAAAPWEREKQKGKKKGNRNLVTTGTGGGRGKKKGPREARAWCLGVVLVLEWNRKKISEAKKEGKKKEG